ncbi:nucleolar protein 8 isoform X1 [Hirundo rustica]|uniref:nucleolar protein 8 isoform X1 n=1 Tax=Hirundo rustica TaxID=43150 RepID=UPI001A93BDCF|nr:nucleolar protein 8 isoform X1 [Hirundo rustica]XP_039932018.1 nucleolar protein 8 isoform X1 [Hirundo rustica]XP_039932019.1 nucleolar protein 8 isoform X1 [Hirundo rustica]XP_039932020.1 nucleolar protein 8 isoform X1 [Hirundo rustica]
MEKEQVFKRLYVGGLGHAVSRAELEERFGKFGRVLEAEIITRRDDQGNPTKTFAYISVNISEADLRKCMSILNKTKWKGGTLQIELAKESFLHRLATEREEAKLQKEKPQRNDQMCLLESLKKTGVVDFHMRAVPGTEVPDHKKWVVGKFGRVLPILHLRNQQKNKVMKYDPSKYCHNLRKLEPDVAHAAPVSQLTWKLEGGDDSGTRKRRGQFPAVKKPPEKRRQLGSEALNGAALSSGCPARPKHTESPQLSQRSEPKPSEELELPPARRLDGKIPGRGLLLNQSNAGRDTAKTKTSVSDSDIDSEEEIRAMVKKETERQKSENVETESEHLEVVGDNFELKYSSHWSLSNSNAMKKAAKGGNKEKETVECDNGYDSADTDEIIAESKTPEDSKQGKVKKKEVLGKKKSVSVNGSSLKTCSLKERIERKRKIKKSRIAALQSTTANSTTETSDSSCSESEKGESEISSDYESMMQNCYHLDLTLDDLKALATENTETSAEGSGSEQSPCQSSIEDNPKDNTVNKPKLSKFHPAVKKKPICPEDVLADILAGEEDAAEESSKGQNNSHWKYQPFRGMGSLCIKELSKDSTGLKKKSVESLGLEAYCGEESSKNQPKNHPLCPPEVSSKKRHKVPCEQHEEQSAAASSAGQRLQPGSRPRLQGKNKGVSSLQDQNSEHGAAAANTDQGDGSSDTDSDAAAAQEHVKRQLQSPKLLSKTLKRNTSEKNPECEDNKGCENTSLLEDKELCLRAAVSKEPSTIEKQLQDNQRRLAALEERHRERELQKKLIQGALSNLDRQPAGKHKHIIFDSDVEDEAEVDEILKKDAHLGNMHGEDKSAPKPSGRLFDSSEDEQEDTDDERFKIKPQFEGKAGEKLLQLQSRFGTDERFRMDARFLESDSEEEAETKSLKADEEEELAAEKKKNLQILGSLLNINLEQPKPNKTATSVKKFKDINALRYDPTREDHAVFERKPSVMEKESKAKKKKKEESETLPRVSEEIYYDIAADFKDLFGSSKNKPEKTEEIPWDKEDVQDSAPDDHLGPLPENDVAQESSAFKFSFFGDREELGIKEEPYVLETIKPVKVMWQEDPRFQDSSSEGDDEPETSEIEKDQEMFLSLPRTESSRVFFFSKDDERLREGPKLFCRKTELSEEKESWEDRRRLLLEECRKKHKDAKRKVRAKQ